ncbi:MAG: UDP-3-O-(3-hydroxymyristoyl)glucosamine N-acyltransferase [Negativicutes bacterium]|nr:UDP-3-O-(3-hydroxymyristoyl)glucosamine N-acyltransferase [Negativicutes bacterium]
MQKSVAELAVYLGGIVTGDSDTAITGVTNIEEAGPGDITFAVPPHLDKAARSRAGAVIIPDSLESFPKPAIRVANPRLAFARLLELYTPPPQVERGIHPTAVIGANAEIGANVAILPYVVIGDDAKIGDNTIIYPHSYIGTATVVGSDTVIYPNVIIREHCRIGSRVIIHSGAVIGSDGFGFITVERRHRKVPQVGNVIIEDDVEIGANVAIDRATTGSTIVKTGTKIDNLVHLAHNVVIGENCFLVAQTGIAGSAKVGNNVTFAGQCGSAGHLTIGDNCVFAARTAVISDVPPGSFFAGFPARPHKEWLRGEASISRVPELMKKVRELEKRLEQLEENK